MLFYKQTFIDDNKASDAMGSEVDFQIATSSEEGDDETESVSISEASVDVKVTTQQQTKSMAPTEMLSSSVMKTGKYPTTT